MNNSLRNAKQMTVETFQVTLDGVHERLHLREDAVVFVEAKLQEQLTGCLRLLRWAIVRVEGSTCWCEGAYLKSH